MSFLLSSGVRSSVIVVEDFEDNDLAEWSGETGDYDVNQTSPVPNGQYRLEKTGNSGKSMRSSSGLNDYPERGDIFTFQFIPGDADALPGFTFFGQDSSKTYELYLQVKNNTFSLREREEFSTLASASLSWTLNQEYTIEIDTSTGDDIVCTATDESDGSTTTISATDNTYNSTEIGIRANNGSTNTSGTVLDYIRITDPA